MQVTGRRTGARPGSQRERPRPAERPWYTHGGWQPSAKPSGDGKGEWRDLTAAESAEYERRAEAPVRPLACERGRNRLSGSRTRRPTGPILVFVIYGLVRRRPWVRPLGLFYAGAAVTNMFFYFATTFWGPTPPPHPAVYLPFNLPWLVAPVILALRLLPSAPFAEAASFASPRRAAA